MVIISNATTSATGLLDVFKFMFHVLHGVARLPVEVARDLVDPPGSPGATGRPPRNAMDPP